MAGMNQTPSRTASPWIPKLVWALAVLLVGNPPLAAQDGKAELSWDAAQSAAAKFERIEHSHQSGIPFDAVRITEHEANSYLHFELSSVFPAGGS